MVHDKFGNISHLLPGLEKTIKQICLLAGRIVPTHAEPLVIKADLLKGLLGHGVAGAREALEISSTQTLARQAAVIQHVWPPCLQFHNLPTHGRRIPRARCLTQHFHCIARENSIVVHKKDVFSPG